MTLPPFHADPVGSLLRLAGLSQLRGRWRAGEVDAATLRAAEDAAIVETVRRQRDCGLPSTTGDEFRRDGWRLDVLSQFDGVTLVDNGGQKFRVAGQSEQPPIASVTGRIGCSTPIMAGNVRPLAGLVAAEGGPEAVAKMAIPSPLMLHLRSGRAAISRAVYPDLCAFWSDVAAACRVAIGHLADGCRYLQRTTTGEKS